MFKKKKAAAIFFENANKQGQRNLRYITSHLNRPWPFWITQQLKDIKGAFALDNNSTEILNTRFRQWTLLSTPQKNEQLIISPFGSSYVQHNPFSLDFWISQSNHCQFPSAARNPIH